MLRVRWTLGLGWWDFEWLAIRALTKDLPCDFDFDLQTRTLKS